MIFLVSLIVSVATTAIAVYQYFVYQSKFWKRRGIPGPDALPFFGNLKDLYKFREPSAYKVNEWTKKYGKVYGYKEGIKNVMVISDMELINEVFVKQFDNFYARRENPLPQDIDTNARVHLFESRGSRWKRLRTLASPSFTINALKKILPIVEDSAVKMVEIMEKRHGGGETFDATRFFNEFTLDTISRLVLGQKGSKLFENPRLDPMQAVFLQKMDRPLFYLARGAPPVGKAIRDTASKFNQQVNRDMQKIHSETAKVVKERIEEHMRDGPPATPADFIDIFLENAADFDFKNSGEFSTQNSITKALTLDEVIAQAVVFLLAGYDTTSNALSYTTWMLSRHPEIMKRCQEEIDDVCTEASISYEDCQNMRYLDAVCRETLRFYPLAARAIARTCMKDTTVGEYEIEKGTTVVADTFAVHFDKELWGEDVDEFRPERWLDNDRRVAAINFLTFGAGPRLCIGMRLATLEEKIALAYLLRRVDILPDPTVSDIKIVGSLTMTPEAVPIRIKSRV